jgi:hypothetical protein
MFKNYQGATAALATMHGKEIAIAPAMRAQLGLNVITPLIWTPTRLGHSRARLRALVRCETL